MILASLLLITASAWSAPIAVPTEIATLADGIRAEKSRTKRLELLAGLMTEVKKRVGEIPDDVAEADLPRIQILYELNILFGSLKPDAINPATCPAILRTLGQMTNPSGVEGADVTSTGRLALDVVKSVCAP